MSGGARADGMGWTDGKQQQQQQQRRMVTESDDERAAAAASAPPLSVHTAGATTFALVCCNRDPVAGAKRQERARDGRGRIDTRELVVVGLFLVLPLPTGPAHWGKKERPTPPDVDLAPPPARPGVLSHSPRRRRISSTAHCTPTTHALLHDPGEEAGPDPSESPSTTPPSSHLLRPQLRTRQRRRPTGCCCCCTPHSLSCS